MSKDRVSEPRSLSAGSVYGYTRTGVALGREDTGILACDQNYAEVLGRSRRELLGAKLPDVADPADLKCSEWLLRSALSERHSVDVRMRCVLPDGRARWTESRVVPVGAPGGDVNVILTRHIPAPGDASASLELRTYIADLARQLAAMAADGGLTTTAEALAAGSQLAVAEGA